MLQVCGGILWIFLRHSSAMPGTHEDFVQQWRIIYPNRSVSFHSDSSWTCKFHWTISYPRENINPKLRDSFFYRKLYQFQYCCKRFMYVLKSVFVFGIFHPNPIVWNFLSECRIYILIIYGKSMVYYLCYLKFVHFHGSFLDKFLSYNLLDHISHFHFCKIFIIVMQ